MNENQLLKTVESTGITTWSFDEINLALDNLLEKYKGKVYTEESYKSAKSDKQELNAINKRIEEKRKEYKKICLAPYNAIEDEIKALTKKIKEQISEIDEYTKAVEEKEKTDKKLKIKEYYDAKSVILGEYAERLFEKLLNIKWLNKTFSEKNWKIEVQDAINTVKQFHLIPLWNIVMSLKEPAKPAMTFLLQHRFLLLQQQRTTPRAAQPITLCLRCMQAATHFSDFRTI